LILREKIWRKDAGKTSTSGAALNLKTRGRVQDKNSGEGKSKSRNGRSKSRSGQQLECWNCGKAGHFKKNCKEPRKKTSNDSANVVVTEEIQDALILSIDGPFDSWVMDLGASFHTTAIREVLKNYVTEHFEKVYLADGTPLDIVGISDVRIRIHNDSVWKLQKVKHISQPKKEPAIKFHGGQ
jgi:hypothetical protein